MAKSGVLHSLIRCRATAGHVLVHDARPRETALDGNGAVAMRLHQALEEPVEECFDRDQDMVYTVGTQAALNLKPLSISSYVCRFNGF